MKNLKKLSIEYFDLFSNKDIEKLKEMFDSSINLRDWEINARGIEEVIKANLNIFNSVDTIKVNPILIVEEDQYIFAELDILVNDKESLKVVDIKAQIEFDKTKPDGTPQKLLDISKARNYGWKSKIKLEEGLLKAYRSFIKLK